MPPTLVTSQRSLGHILTYFQMINLGESIPGQRVCILFEGLDVRCPVALQKSFKLAFPPAVDPPENLSGSPCVTPRHARLDAVPQTFILKHS